MTDTASAAGTDDEERRTLERLERRALIPPAERAALSAAAGRLVAAAAAISRDPSLGERERRAVELEKWQAMHRLVHRSAWRDDPKLPRSAQWAAARRRLAGIGDVELDAWISLQVEVALNRQQGIVDLRPRKDGPTFLVLLEHVANAKRKAKALLDWAVAAEADGDRFETPAQYQKLKRK